MMVVMHSDIGTKQLFHELVGVQQDIRALQAKRRWIKRELKVRAIAHAEAKERAPANAGASV